MKTFELGIHKIEDERIQLLTDSLQSRAHRDAIHALKALSLLSDRETLSTAIANLQNHSQIPNALEALKSLREAALIRPLFRIWEPANEALSTISVEEVIADLITEKDEWLRACAIFAKDEPMETLTTLSSMERILLLRHVQLLADLSASDLQLVAALATENNFSENEVICDQGEEGNEMFIIVSGEVRIVVKNKDQHEKEIARRAVGDVVGEMSLISGGTRAASVIALGDVRTLCLDRLSFESLLRERPEVCLAVMRELCNRLKERM